jgi:hypothetical protein
MRTIVCAIACAVALSPAGSAQKRFPVSDESSSQRTLRFAAGAAERLLEVRLASGSIHVVGTDGADVTMELRRRTRARSEADLRIAAREVEPEFLDGGSRVGAIVRDEEQRVCGERVDGRGDWQSRGYDVSFDVTIRVPRDARLRLCAISGERIDVAQTAGDFDISLVNGSIVLRDVRGSGSLETVNGNVRAAFAAAPAAASSFKTINGDLDVTFPAGLAADFRLKTFNGGLFTDFDVVMPARPAPVAVARNGDQRVYQSNVHTVVRVGRGGPEMTFETFNGDVRIRRASR